MVVVADWLEGLTARQSGLPTSPSLTRALSPLWTKAARYVRATLKQCLCVSLPRTNSIPDHGSCHCGAVTLAVKVDKPLEDRDITVDEERIVECNCSICSRVRLAFTRSPVCVADTLHRVHTSGFIHLKRTWSSRAENTSPTARSTRTSSARPSASTVGRTSATSRIHLQVRSQNDRASLLSIANGVLDYPLKFPLCGFSLTQHRPLDAELEALDDATRAFRDRSKIMRPITLRVLDDFDFKTVKTNQLDGWNIVKPLYVNP